MEPLPEFAQFGQDGCPPAYTAQEVVGSDDCTLVGLGRMSVRFAAHGAAYHTHARS
jgi:hypothetical protein